MDRVSHRLYPQDYTEYRYMCVQPRYEKKTSESPIVYQGFASRKRCRLKGLSDGSYFGKIGLEIRVWSVKGNDVVGGSLATIGYRLKRWLYGPKLKGFIIERCRGCIIDRKY